VIAATATSGTLVLELSVRDPDVIAELSKCGDRDERHDYALSALRLGVLALRHARGEVDSRAIKREGERLLGDVRIVLQEHAASVTAEVAGSLRQFLDPATGVLPQRLENLVKRDGELDALLARHLKGDASELARTLAEHVGQRSPLFRMLSPKEADGILAVLTSAIGGALEQHRLRITSEFSLDVENSALSRLVREIVDGNGQLRAGLQQDLSAIVGQFSLDDRDSALSRLVRQVDEASREITQHFSLDVEDSSLNRLRRELVRGLEELMRSQAAFQTEVRATLEAFRARKQEATRSTRHGGEFEELVCELLGEDVRRLGDVFAACGATTGRIPYSKVGDAVAALGPDTAAAGRRVAIEAKAQKGYDVVRALDEIRVARENRDAEVGIFVFDKRVAPLGVEPIARFGNDLVVVWDSDDPSTDIRLGLAYSVARALLVAQARTATNARLDFAVVDCALAELRKKAESLEEVSTWTQTIKNSSEKIEARTRAAREALNTQIERLQQQLESLRRDSPAADQG
jgi:hypothetical protein